MAYIPFIGKLIGCKEGERLHDIFESYLFEEIDEAFTAPTKEAFYNYVNHRIDCKECRYE